MVWIALNDDRPLFAFAGIWTTFNGDRGTKSKPIPGPHLVFRDDYAEPSAARKLGVALPIVERPRTRNLISPLLRPPPSTPMQ